MTPSEDEFTVWREDPVTRWVLMLCRKTAHQAFEAWSRGAWESGTVDPQELVRDRTRADAYLALEQTDYDGWVAAAESEEATALIPTPKKRDQIEYHTLAYPSAEYPGFGDMAWWTLLMVIGVLIGAVLF